MKNVLPSLIALFALPAFAASSVSEVSMAQSADRQVEISYRLIGDPAIVTVDIRTNSVDSGEWVSIGESNLRGFAGDVYTVQQPNPDGAKHVMTWNPRLHWPDHRVGSSAGGVKAVVTAWSTNAPPDCMVVDLVEPFGVTWYPSMERLPESGGVTNKVYKDRYLVMRRIHAAGKVWGMGSPSRTLNRKDAEVYHNVALSHDYYIGVYPLTVNQHLRVKDAHGHTEEDNRAPAYAIRFTDMRGSKKGVGWPSYDDDGNFDWEASSDVDATSWLGKFRARYASYGIRIDMPTEAQWEYAYRAGIAHGYLYSNESYEEGNARKLGRCSSNKGEPDSEGLTGDKSVVGSYLPNGWGLYDMFGNVTEACLDVYEDWSVCNAGTSIDTSRIHLDPVGARRGEGTASRIFRGASYTSEWKRARLGDRFNASSDTGTRSASQGYRLAWTLR